MTNLFDRGGLQQDTGLIKERWGQDGSVIVNIADSFASDRTLYTVTAGKVFYCTTAQIAQNNTTSGGGFIRDGGAAGDSKIVMRLGNVAGQNVVVNYSTPIVFETDVYADIWGGASVAVILTGWEE